MELIAKIYSSQFSATPYTQVTEILELEINETVNDVGDGTIVIPKYVVGIKKYQFVEICKIYNDTDVILFRGYIADFTPKKSVIEINLKSEKGILEFKKVLTNATFTANTIVAIVQSLITAWNSAHGDTFSIVSSSSYSLPKKDVKFGDNLKDILDEFATSADCVWDCVRGVIRIEPLLGDNYTIGTVIKELCYNELDPMMSNIDDYSVSSGEQGSIILGTDGTVTTKKTDNTAVSDFGSIAITKQFRKSDITTLNAETQEFLDKVKNTSFLYELSIDQNRFEANCGDKVLLRIENTGSYSDFLGDCIVNEKKYTLENGTLKIKYVVSDKYFLKSDFYKTFSQIKKDLSLQIIK